MILFIILGQRVPMHAKSIYLFLQNQQNDLVVHFKSVQCDSRNSNSQIVQLMPDPLHNYFKVLQCCKDLLCLVMSQIKSK